MRWMMASCYLGIAKSSAAFLGCKHQARNGHAKGEKAHPHLLGYTSGNGYTIHRKLYKTG